MPPSSNAPSLSMKAEPEFLLGIRRVLFQNITIEAPLKALAHHADIVWGPRDPAVTPSEKAEFELYMKIKSKADHAQLKKLMQKVLDLEAQAKEGAQEKTRKTSRDDLSSDDAIQEPQTKRVRPHRRIIADNDTSDEDVPAASGPKRRVISKPDDEPITQRRTQQNQHQRPATDSSDEDHFVSRHPKSRESEMHRGHKELPASNPLEEDELTYDDDDMTPDLRQHMARSHASQDSLLERVERAEKELHIPPLPPLPSSDSTTDYTNEGANPTRSRPQPRVALGDNNDPESSDEEFAARNTAQPPATSKASAGNHASPDASIRRDSLVSQASRDLMPPPRTIIRADPNESDAVVYRRAEATVMARNNPSPPPDAPRLTAVRAPMGQSSDRYKAPYAPRLRPVRAPVGRSSDRHDAPDDEPDDANYVPPEEDESEDEEKDYIWENRRKYRIVRHMENMQQDDGTSAFEEMEAQCLSDAEPESPEKKPKMPRKIWSEDWNPKPDNEPKGAKLFAVPAGDVPKRTALSTLELTRKTGMEAGIGSEHVHGERRMLAKPPKGKARRGLEFYYTTPSALGPDGSVMGPPPTTISQTSMRYSVREKGMVERKERGMQRGINRITPVGAPSEADTGVDRSILERMGFEPNGGVVDEEAPTTVPGQATHPTPGKPVRELTLTLTNVARLEKETGGPKNMAELIHGKQRDAVPGEEDRMTWRGEGSVRGAREGSVTHETLYASSVVHDEAGKFVSQSFRTRAELNARTTGSVPVIPSPTPDDHLGPLALDEMEENVRRTNAHLSPQEAENEAVRRQLETESEMGTLRATQSAVPLDYWPGQDMRSVAADSSASRQATNPRGRLLALGPTARRAAPTQISTARSGNQGGPRRRGGQQGGRGGGGSQFGGSYRGGRGGGSQFGGSQRGGRAGGFVGRKKEVDPNAEYEAMVAAANAEFPFQQ